MAWAVGDEGTILWTTDGGQIWQRLDSGTRHDLRDVFFIDSATGWVVGQGMSSVATILHTGDGGDTWIEQVPGSPAVEGDLNAVAFLGKQNGWAGGESSDREAVILGTSDGGREWTVQYRSSTGGAIRDVCFTSLQKGHAVGDGCSLLRTTDGGGSWILIGPSSIDNPDNLDIEEAKLYSLSFADDDHGWAMGENVILATSDGGASWRARALQVRFADGTEGPYHLSRFWRIRAVRFVSPTDGWAFGWGWGEIGVILRTDDGGLTWTEQTGWLQQRLQGNAERFKHYVFGAAMASAQEGWAVGGGGLVLRTIDGGHHWDEVTAAMTRTELWDVAFVDDKQGYAVGSYGVFLRTTDGKTWCRDETNIPGMIHFEGITRAGSRLWLAGYGSSGGEDSRGRLYWSANNGATWSEVEEIADSGGAPLDLREVHLHSVIFIDDDNGWVAGSLGTILHSSDGGAHWACQETGINEDLRAITFVDLDHGWAVTFQGSVMRTTNGGAVWTQVASDVTRWLKAVAFVDPENGWVGGQGGIYCSSDGGSTWSRLLSYEVCPPTAENVTSIVVLDEENVWAVGAGEIYRTTSGGKDWADWAVEDPGSDNVFWSIAAISPDEVWAVGEFGNILHRSGE
jgi:photosystem II stability/assembly factor-like uncharacterized protein